MKAELHARGTILLLLTLLFVVSFFAQDIEVMKTGVVKVTTTTREALRKVGTGFVVRLEADAATIVTASHVVQDASEVHVEFFTQRNRPVRARVTNMEGGDSQGLAVLLVEKEIPSGLSVLKLTTSVPVRGGDLVTTIGFPLISKVPWAVIRGDIIGQTGKTISFSGTVEEGNSDGPLIKDGLVIGVVTKIREKYAYAIPSEIARYVLSSWGVEFKEGEVRARSPLENSKIAFVSTRDGNDEIYVMTADRTTTRLTNHEKADAMPSWSPDGMQIAFVSLRDFRQSIYVMNDDGTNPTRLTDHPGKDSSPSWSPDGKKIAFNSARDRNWQIYIMNANGTNPQRLTDGHSASWLPLLR